MTETAQACPVGGERALTPGESALVREVFGDAIDTSRVTIRRRKWWWFQPRNVTMAPTGHLHFHPTSGSYCEDFSRGAPGQQAHFIHEMTHVWQMQQRGWWYVPFWGALQRTYRYTLKPGRPLRAYGIEQQAEIVSDAFALKRGWRGEWSSDLPALLAALPAEFALKCVG